MILVARLLTTSDFGTFAVGFSCFAVGLALARANLGVPLSVDLPRETDRRTINETIGRSVAAALVTGVVTGIVVGGVGLVASDSGTLRTTLLLLACASPFLVVQDVARYVAIAQATPVKAVVSDLLWVCTGIAVLVASAVSDGLGVLGAAGGWVVGGLLALVSIRSCVRLPLWHGTLGWFGGDRRRRHLTLDALTAAVTPLLVVTLVAAVCSPTTVGSLRGASTLMSPINVGLAAVGLGAVAEITRRPRSHAQRFMAVVSIGLAVSSVLWAATVWLLPASAGAFILGPTWDSARQLLPVIAVEFVGLSVWTGAIAMLRASGRTGVSASMRGVYLLVATIATGMAAVFLGTAVGIQAALAASAAVLALISWASVLRGTPRQSLDPDTRAATT